LERIDAKEEPPNHLLCT